LRTTLFVVRNYRWPAHDFQYFLSPVSNSCFYSFATIHEMKRQPLSTSKSVAVITSVFWLAGCASPIDDAADHGNVSAENVPASSLPTPIPAPAATPALHNVVLRVTGVLSEGSTPSRPWLIKASSSYSSGTVALPHVENLTKATGEDVSIDAQNVDWDMGQLQIDIEVDGKLVNRVMGNSQPLLSASYRIPPAGASAACMDKTFSFSRNRQGTCSNHGGVYAFYFADGSIDYEGLKSGN
jgi:hypothetical protein